MTEKSDVLNSDPAGRKHDNVDPAYFGATRRGSRAGVSLCNLRPSFFAMLKREEKRPPKPARYDRDPRC